MKQTIIISEENGNFIITTESPSVGFTEAIGMLRRASIHVEAQYADVVRKLYKTSKEESQ